MTFPFFITNKTIIPFEVNNRSENEERKIVQFMGGIADASCSDNKIHNEKNGRC